MAKQAINIGTLADDGTGDTLRAALDKCNDNFDELYALTDGSGAASVLTLAAGSASLGDTTISDATPILIFKDSSCTDADNNATILVAATETGTNAENIDVTLTQQVGGVATNWLISDADGSITLGDATRAIVLSGAVTSGDVTISGSLPSLILIDSDTADKDAGVSIIATATASDAGAENVDLMIAQQVSGGPKNVLVADADGLVTLGDGTRRIALNGKLDGDVTIYDATPVLTLIDSDTADKDAGISITATCTTTTAGAEHVDATFTQQVGGSPVNFLVADADGSITLGDGTRAIALNGVVGDVTIKDATPVLQFKDSSCDVSDVNAYIEVTATDTGDGSEDIDVAIYQQVAGNSVACFFANADGALTLGYGGQPVYIAKLQSLVTVTANTGAATPANTDSGTVYTNEGDDNGSSVTLPAAVAGLQFTIYVQVAQTLTITAGAEDTIRIGSSVTAAAGSITSATVGSSVTLVAINATEWVATASVGSWSF